MLSGTLRTDAEYPDTHTWAAVAVAKISPGVRKRFGSITPVGIVTSIELAVGVDVGAGVGLGVGVGVGVGEGVRVGEGLGDGLRVAGVVLTVNAGVACDADAVFFDDRAFPTRR